MFELQCWSEPGRPVDPRDLPAVPESALWRSNRDRLAAVLNARVEALGESSQLDLATEAAGCKAVLDWTLCKVASSFVIKDATSPLVAQAMQRSGGIGLIQLGGPETPAVSEGAVPALALALSCSEYAARDYIAVGLDLRFRLRCTNNDLGGGRISFSHAKVISEATRTLSVDAAEQLDARLADAAQSRTPGRLRVLARRLMAKADPDAMQARHAAAMAGRSASAFEVGDGMGVLSLDHQLDVIAAIDTELDEWARRRRLADPGTGFAAHRADAAALLLLGSDPLTGRSLFGPRDAGVPGDAVDPDVADSEGARRASAPDAGQPSAGAPDMPGWPGGVFPQPTGNDSGDRLPVHTELRLTMGADTLLGLDDETCELDGWGPITAVQARRLALRAASTVLRRVFTDPVDFSVMTLDAGSYRFTASQLRAIEALHPISTFPGATTQAGKCQTDHRIPYRHGPPGQQDAPSQTTVCNGQPLGIRHHRIRTHLGWSARVQPDDPHTIVWTTQHGKHVTVADHQGA